MIQLHGISGTALTPHSCVGNITLLRRKTGNTVLLGYIGREQKKEEKSKILLGLLFCNMNLFGTLTYFLPCGI